MSVVKVLSRGRTWIAAAAAAIAVTLLCALGAALMQSGVLPQHLGGSWVCAACLLAGVLCGGIAGGLTGGMIAVLAAAALALGVSLLMPGGLMITGQSVRCMAALAIGAGSIGVLAALRKGNRGGRKRRRPVKMAPRRR